jgi:hypothetical protein
VAEDAGLERSTATQIALIPEMLTTGLHTVSSAFSLVFVTTVIFAGLFTM